MITVIDLGISNISSVRRALQHLAVDVVVTNRPSEVGKAEKLILPGVGTFSEGMEKLRSLQLDNVLREMVISENIPILGICLGMQLFAISSEEGGFTKGLGFINAKTCLHRAVQQGLRVPHIGWNDVQDNNLPLFDSIDNNTCFYFIHSYEVVPTEPAKVSYCNYGVDFVAAIQNNNIHGVQFHPEKSQAAGLRLLNNFCAGVY